MHIFFSIPFHPLTFYYSTFFTVFQVFILLSFSHLRLFSFSIENSIVFYFSYRNYFDIVIYAV